MSPAFGYRTPDYAGGISAFDSRHYLPCCYPSGQPFLTAGFSGRYVLLVPDDSAYHKGNVVKSFIIGLVALISRSVFRNRTGGILHTGCQRRICSYGWPDSKYPRRLWRRRARLRFQPLLLGYLPPDLQSEDYRSCHPSYTCARNGCLQPYPAWLEMTQNCRTNV